MAAEPIDHHHEIRTAGLRLFATRGTQDVSVAEICRAADVANGTFYNFYKDKTELVAELVREASERLAAELRAAERFEENAYADHYRDVEIIVRFSEANRDLVRLALMDDGVKRSLQPSVADIFAEQRARAILRGKRLGVYRNDLNAKLVAYAEIGLMTEVLNWWNANPKRMSGKKLIEELTALRVRLTSGYGPDESGP